MSALSSNQCVSNSLGGVGGAGNGIMAPLTLCRGALAFESGWGRGKSVKDVWSWSKLDQSLYEGSASALKGGVRTLVGGAPVY